MHCLYLEWTWIWTTIFSIYKHINIEWQLLIAFFYLRRHLFFFFTNSVVVRTRNLEIILSLVLSILWPFFFIIQCFNVTGNHPTSRDKFRIHGQKYVSKRKYKLRLKIHIYTHSHIHIHGSRRKQDEKEGKVGLHICNIIITFTIYFVGCKG